MPIEKTSLAAEEGPPVDPARSVGGGVLDLELGATGASSAASPVQA